MIYEFNIKPVSKGRPRAVGRGKFITLYTPKTTKDYEEEIKRIGLEYFKKPYYGILSVDIKFIFEPVKSTSKKLREELIGKPYFRKPDIDNLIKSFVDGLNGVAWDDDSQIYSVNASKYYGNENKILLEINELAK